MMARGSRKATPFSIRLRSEDDQFVSEEARRLQRSKGAIVEAYVSEAIRERRFPGIAFRDEDYRRRATVLGTGLDVWELIALLRDFETPEELAEAYRLTPAQIRAALAYYREYGDEIDDLIARGRRSEEELLERYPFIGTFEQADTAE
jgi:uncharacterized protein (DUF433 family)